MTEPGTPPTQRPEVPPPQFERDEDFVSLYANNIWHEVSAWDLKLIFGQLDQARTPNVVTQHTAMALGWLQVKLLIYYLQVDLAVYESQYGKIVIPAAILPPPPGPLPPEMENDPVAKASSEPAREIYALWAERPEGT